MTTLPYPTAPGDIDHRIVDDHDVVRALFAHLEAERGDRRTLCDQAVFFLSAHTAAEEAVLYPCLADSGDEELAEQSRHSHQQMKDLAATVQRGKAGTVAFDDALHQLIIEVGEHAAEEESWLGRLRERVGADTMAELGERFGTVKMAAPTRSHRHAPDAGVAQKVVGLASGVADHARDLATGRQHRIGTDASGLLDPQAQAVADAYGRLGPLPLDTLPPLLARRQPTMADAMRSVLHNRQPLALGSTVMLEDHQIPGSVEHPPLPLRMYREHSLGDDAVPVIIYAHGGGWVLGDLDAYDENARALAEKTRCAVISVGYRPAPENPFPTAHGDLLSATMWILRQAEDLHIDPHRFVLCGEDAGANMAVTTAIDLSALDFERPELLVLIAPIVTADQDGPSFLDNADAQPYTRPAVSWMLNHLFAGSPKGVRDLRFELLARTPDDLRHLPPTVVVTAERDVLRDQGRAFADRVRQAGVNTTALHYLGLGHEFFGAGLAIAHAAQAQDEVAQEIRAAVAPT